MVRHYESTDRPTMPVALPMLEGITENAVDLIVAFRAVDMDVRDKFEGFDPCSKKLQHALLKAMQHDKAPR